tara:strand:- start:350 stop:598 length:249 start_codon:yes stop_codon:yes gene_type:complete
VKKRILILLFFPSSCEKESIYINGCPDLIRNVNLKDFPMDFYGTNEIVLEENEMSVTVNYGGGCECKLPHYLIHSKIEFISY